MTDQKKLVRKQRFSLRQNKKRGKYSSDVNDLQSTSSTAFPVSKGKEILVDEHIYSYPISMPQSFSRDNRISNHLTHDENEDVDMLATDEFGSRKLYNEGDPIYECQYCGTYFWYAERIDKKCKKKRLVFTLCCGHGKIKLPNPKDPPTVLKELLFGSGEKSNHFRENIRTYNSMFSFTSMGGKIDASVNQTKGPRTFRLSGQNYHKIGSLLPNEGSTPKFAQLYIYDTENEVTNRMNVIRLNQRNLRTHLYKGLQEAVLHGDTEPSSQGQRIILSSTFTGGTRYMLQNYQDAMAICKWAGYPDLFITFTCNPKWPEIKRFVHSRGLHPEDRPDIITRVFKIKLDHLIKDLRDNKVFGEVKADSKVVDEIKMYCDCRYISSCEAAWRIFKFPIHHREPSVERLSFHLPDNQNVIFSDDDPIDVVINKPTVKESMFLRWLEANKEFPEARHLTYAEFPLKFVWKQQSKRWEKRKTSAFSIGRIFFVPPGSGEQYYLRLLLNVVKGPTSYEEIRRINDIYHETFRDACYALGLLDDDKEFVDAIVEASQWGMPSYLRQLFAMLLISNSMSRPEIVWQSTWHLLSEDIVFEERRILDNPEVYLSEADLKNRCLQKIETFLKGCGRSFQDFSTMPLPVYNEDEVDYSNRLIRDEMRYNKGALTDEHQELLQNLTDEQKAVYKKIMSAVITNSGGFFFLYGFGGTGKTFIWRTLSAAIRSKGDIVLTVASSGIASLLLPGGRTSHSRFVIPLNINEDSTCNIKQGTPLANLIVKAKLIIWDEAPMMHKYCFEALDKTLRDIISYKDASKAELPFGGKTVVLGGDFRQILPVIPKGTRQDIVNATANSSYLWPQCQLLTLTKNMRLQSNANDTHLEELRDFSNWILKVGDGSIGSSIDGIDKISSLANCNDPEYLQQRAILAPTLDMVESINQYMITLNHNPEKSYLSSDKICRSDHTYSALEHVHTPEFLNNIKCSGVPNHSITLKVGVPVMLLRNIDQSAGLCNGTRLIVTKLGNQVIEAKVLSGQMVGRKVFIPRMTLTPSDYRIPFKFQRRQFPITVSFAMTINKSQGQSLSHVGLFLKKPVFTHGQLYVALSRVTNRKGLKILTYDEDGQISNEATNVSLIM
ncbi:hypothetical protein KY290_005154 [Solanum tuberosum]|uniref:ATP-dependent DNA helicase n=1 Tax=Solanum tuberosum TaxID=4113 RepID=A0ABQ7WFR9_SOLTU|nr:hypothetical protein KY290_005154 [Solanum tuberosum]